MAGEFLEEIKASLQATKAQIVQAGISIYAPETEVDVKDLGDFVQSKFHGSGRLRVGLFLDKMPCVETIEKDRRAFKWRRTWDPRLAINEELAKKEKGGEPERAPGECGECLYSGEKRSGRRISDEEECVILKNYQEAVGL